MDARILVPLDGSPHAERIIPFAEALARALGAGLHLLCVLDPQRPTGDGTTLASEGAARAYLARWVAQLDRQGVAVSMAVGRGDVAAAIEAEAARRPLAAVALASHGRELLGRGAGGSVVAELLTRVAVPILVVRDWHAAATCRHLAVGASIVVPLDGSPHAEAALPFARGLATALGGELLLVRIVPPMPTWPAPTGSAETPRPIAAEQAAARAYLNATSARLGARTLPTRLGTGVGDVATALAALAGRDERTLLVMATHGQTGDAQIPLGSVAREVFWRCEAPLILVPPPAPAASPLPAPQERPAPNFVDDGTSASPAP